MSPYVFFAPVVIVCIVLLRMQPRRYYLIRHGETLLNKEHVRQGEDGGLSELGQLQAEEVGVFLKQFHIGRIIASTYPRAKETAEIINLFVKTSVVSSPLLVERRNPSDIIGKKTRDPDVMRIVDEMDLSFHKDDYRHLDEESFVELKERARKCLSLLARQGPREIAVVTHHVFLKMLLAYMLYHEQVTAAEFIKLSFFNISDNAGITICEFHPWKMFTATGGWEIVTYNEQPGSMGEGEQKAGPRTILGA